MARLGGLRVGVAEGQLELRDELTHRLLVTGAVLEPTEQAGDGIYYRVCGPAGSSHTGGAPVDLFCAGGDVVSKNPAKGFQSTLQAAQAGYVPAQEVAGMMYAVGKGVQQDYHEAAKWFLTAAEAGNPRAAANYVGGGRSGLYNLRSDTELGGRWARFLALHPEYSPVPGR